MKRIILTCIIACVSFWSINSMAADAIGVLDMEQILQSAPQVKTIETSLQKQFTERKNKIDQISKSLQSEMVEYQKNKAVMDGKSLTALENKINTQRQSFQDASVSFQRDLAQARKEATDKFLDQIKQIVATIATDKQLDIVVPKGILLYSKNSEDITQQVLTALKK